MSLQAVTAVLQVGKQVTDAGWRLLMLLAFDANGEGLASEVSIPGYAKGMGRGAGGVAGVKSALVKGGQLVVVTEQKDGKRGTYRLELPGLGQSPTGDAVDKSLLPPTADRPKGVKAETWTEFWRAGYPFLPQEVKTGGEALTDPAHMVAADALVLLQEGRKVASRVVTPRELGLAAVCLLIFNRDFEWKGKKGSDFGLGGSLTEIVQRIRDRPNWDAETWRRLVESAWRIRWWEKRASGGRPTPAVIWSPKSFEQVVQDATEEKERQQNTPAATGRQRHFTREARQ